MSMLPGVKTWQMGILLPLTLILAACSGTPQPSPNNNVPSNSHQLIVYVVGLGEQLLASDTTRNGGYGYEKSFYEPGAIQPYLQATNDFKNAQSLVFSYEGFILDGEPQTFSCTDTFNNRIAFDASLLNLQISQYLKKHPQTEVYIVAHSLGGVIAFAYMASQIENTHSTALENGGVLKGIAILDSPLGGVTNESGYENAIITKALTCDFQEVDYTTIGDLQTLFNTASSLTQHGETASILNAFMGGKYVTNEQVATDAMKAGMQILIVGNEHDLLWQPEICGLGRDFLSTEYLRELGKQGKGALYSRSFVDPSGTLNGLIECPQLLKTGAYHSVVLRRQDVEKAIWETFTDRTVDQLTPVTDAPAPPLSQQTIYVGGQDGTIYALNASDGTQRWKYQTSSQYAPVPQVVDGVVYFILDDANTQSSTLYALNAVDGTLRKTYTLPYYAFNGDPYIPPFAVANGVIYVSGVDKAFALNSNDGSRLWQYPWNGLGASAPLVVNNLMFAVTYQADVYAFNSASGTLSWKYILGPDAEPPGALSGHFAPPVILNNILYVLGWLTKNVYAINVATHTLVWHAQLANAGVSALYVADGSIYVDAHSYPSESVYALQAATGAQLWRKNNLSLRFADSTALYCAGVGSDGSLNGDFFALHFDGTTMWQIHLGNAGSYGLWTTVVQTVVYISTETALHAFRITDGSLLWQIPISGDVVAP